MDFRWWLSLIVVLGFKDIIQIIFHFITKIDVLIISCDLIYWLIDWFSVNLKTTINLENTYLPLSRCIWTWTIDFLVGIRTGFSMLGFNTWVWSFIMWMNRFQSLSWHSYRDANYAYWKVWMRDFLKSIYERMWLNIAKRWKLSVISVDGVKVPKNVENWTRDEVNKCN